MSLLPIEKGCQAIIINSKFDNNGKFVVVGDFIGVNKKNGKLWEVDMLLIGVRGVVDNIVPECQLMRIDGHKEEVKHKEVELIK